MMIGLGAWIGTADGSRVLRSWNAAPSASASTGLVTLPSWLTVACATTGRTTMVGAASLVKGLGANAARARNVGAGWGLSIESARKNWLKQSETFGATWSPLGGGSVSADGATAPDGTSTMDGAVDVNGVSNYYGFLQDPTTYPVNASTVCTSVWARSGSKSIIHLFMRASGNYSSYFDLGAGQIGTVGSSVLARSISGTGGLYRCSVAYPENTSFPNRQFRAAAVDNGAQYTGTGAVALWFWGAQQENGIYPSSYIPNTTGQTARAADVLTVGTPSNIAPGGYYDVDLTIAPNYAQGETSADHPWLYFGAGSQLYYKQSDQKLYLQVPGASDIASGSLTFSRETAIRVRATHRADGRRLRVWTDSNGTIVYDSGVQVAANALSLGSSVGVLGDTSTSAECADLRSITVYRP